MVKKIGMVLGRRGTDGSRLFDSLMSRVARGHLDTLEVPYKTKERGSAEDSPPRIEHHRNSGCRKPLPPPGRGGM